MRVNFEEDIDRGEIVLGVRDIDNGYPVSADEEVSALTEFFGDGIHQGLQPIVKQYRQEYCQQENCCLMAEARETSTHVPMWADDRDVSEDFPTVTIEIKCGSSDCNSKAQDLTNSVAGVALAAVDIIRNAEEAEKEAMAPANKKSQEIMQQAENEAAKVLGAARTRAVTARTSIIESARANHGIMAVN